MATIKCLRHRFRAIFCFPVLIVKYRYVRINNSQGISFRDAVSLKKLRMSQCLPCISGESSIACSKASLGLQQHANGITVKSRGYDITESGPIPATASGRKLVLFVLIPVRSIAEARCFAKTSSHVTKISSALGTPPHASSGLGA